MSKNEKINAEVRKQEKFCRFLNRHNGLVKVFTGLFYGMWGSILAFAAMLIIGYLAVVNIIPITHIPFWVLAILSGLSAVGCWVFGGFLYSYSSSFNESFRLQKGCAYSEYEGCSYQGKVWVAKVDAKHEKKSWRWFSHYGLEFSPREDIPCQHVAKKRR